MHGARRLIFSKGRDAHDYKFSAAVFEDFHRLSPEHRARFLAGSLYWLKGTADPDNDLIRRARGMLAG
jgi:hypothetical protein